MAIRVIEAAQVPKNKKENCKTCNGKGYIHFKWDMKRPSWADWGATCPRCK